MSIVKGGGLVSDLSSRFAEAAAQHGTHFYLTAPRLKWYHMILAAVTHAIYGLLKNVFDDQ